MYFLYQYKGTKFFYFLYVTLTNVLKAISGQVFASAYLIPSLKTIPPSYFLTGIHSFIMSNDSDIDLMSKNI
jgi:hypothetical protein